MPIVSFPPSGDFLGKPIADPYLEERDKAEQQSREVVEEAQTQEPFDSDFGTVPRIKPIDLNIEPSPQIDDDSLGASNQFTKGFTAGFEETKALLGGGARALVGSAIGDEEMTQAGLEYYVKAMQEASKYSGKVEKIEDSFDSFGAMGDYLAYTSGKVLPSILSAIGTGGFVGLAAQVGGKKLVKEGAEKTIKELTNRKLKDKAEEEANDLIIDQVKNNVEGQLARQAMRRNAQNTVTRNARRLGIAGTGALTTGLEGGGTFAEIYREEGIEAPKTALAAGILAGTLDTIATPLRVLKGVFPDKLEPFKDFAADSISGKYGKAVTNVLKESMMTAGVEGVTEALQEIVNFVAVDFANNNLTNDEKVTYLNKLGNEEGRSQILNAFAAGVVGGGTVQTPVSVAREGANQIKINQAGDKQIEDQSNARVIAQELVDQELGTVSGETEAVDTTPTRTQSIQQSLDNIVKDLDAAEAEAEAEAGTPQPEAFTPDIEAEGTINTGTAPVMDRIVGLDNRGENETEVIQVEGEDTFNPEGFGGVSRMLTLFQGDSETDAPRVPGKDGQNIELKPVSQYFDGEFLIDDNQNAVANAILDLAERGMPKQFLDNISGVHVFDETANFPDDAEGASFIGKNSIAVRNTIVGDAVQDENKARRLRSDIAHETFHVADNVNGYSLRDDFRLSPVAVETETDGSGVTFEGSELISELIGLYNQGTEVGAKFTYPLAGFIEELSSVPDSQKRTDLTRAAQTEMFAQLGSVYLSMPAKLKKEAPLAYNFMKSIRDEAGQPQEVTQDASNNQTQTIEPSITEVPAEVRTPPVDGGLQVQDEGGDRSTSEPSVGEQPTSGELAEQTATENRDESGQLLPLETVPEETTQDSDADVPAVPPVNSVTIEDADLAPVGKNPIKKMENYEREGNVEVVFPDGDRYVLSYDDNENNYFDLDETLEGSFFDTSDKKEVISQLQEYRQKVINEQNGERVQPPEESTISDDNIAKVVDYVLKQTDDDKTITQDRLRKKFKKYNESQFKTMFESIQEHPEIRFDPETLSYSDVLIDYAPKKFTDDMPDFIKVSTRFPTSVYLTRSQKPENKREGSSEDPLENLLVNDYESFKASPAFAKNIKIVRKYNNLTSKESQRADKSVAEALIEHSKNNLLYLYDQVPEAIRNRSKLWYVGANTYAQDLALKYSNNNDQISLAQASAVIANLSPQKDWYMNASVADRTMSVYYEHNNQAFDDKMKETSQRVLIDKKDISADSLADNKEALALIGDKSLRDIWSDETLSDARKNVLTAYWIRVYDETYNDRSFNIVSPEGDILGVKKNIDGQNAKVAWGSFGEIAKAVSVLRDGSDNNISLSLGSQNKVRNFYNNIFDPMADEPFVTIDTHAVAASLLKPLSGDSKEVTHNFGGGNSKKGIEGASSSSISGHKGMYSLYEEAYRRAASERGVLPREMQSITWEAVRGLFSPSYKASEENVALIESVWDDYKRGKITLDQARSRIHDSAGRIQVPDWTRPDSDVDGGGQATDNEGEVSGESVLGQSDQPNGTAVSGRGVDAAGVSPDQGVTTPSPERPSQKRNPVLQQAVQDRVDRKLTAQEFNKIWEQEGRYVTPYTEDIVPEVVSDERGINALTKTNREKAPRAPKQSYWKAHKFEEGKRYGARLDIPSYTQLKDENRADIVTVHESRTNANKGSAGKRISYVPTIRLKNVVFAVPEPAAYNVAVGKKDKNTFATIEGDFVEGTDEQNRASLIELLNDSEWTQVSMNPERHSYFYTLDTQQPVTSAEEAIQVGNLVLAKNVQSDKAVDDYMYIRHPAYTQAPDLAATRNAMANSIEEVGFERGGDPNELTNKDLAQMDAESASLLRALKNDDYLGFDNIDDLLLTVFDEGIDNYDPSLATKQALGRYVTKNYGADSYSFVKNSDGTRQSVSLNLQDHTDIANDLQRMAEKLPFYKNIVDAFPNLKELERRIAFNLGLEKLPAGLSAYDQENLMPGRSSEDFKDIQKQFVEPLAGLIEELGLSPDEVGYYLLAKHAPERNAVIAQKAAEHRAKLVAQAEKQNNQTALKRYEENPAPFQNYETEKGGSGISNQEAQRILDGAEADGNTAKLEESVAIIYKMLQYQRDKMVSSGLLDEESRADWEDTYQFYVPLKGFAAEEGSDFSDYSTGSKTSGFSIKGSESLKALGRTTLPLNPVYTSIIDVETKAVRGRKNEIANKLLEMLRTVGNTDQWTIWTNKKRPTAKFDPARMMDMREMDTATRKDGQTPRFIRVKKGGQTFWIEFDSDTLNAELHKMGERSFANAGEIMSKSIGLLSSFQNFRRNMLINYNPTFGITNPFRDVESSLMYLLSEKDAPGSRTQKKSLIGKVAKNYFPAMGAYWRHQYEKSGKNDKAKEWDKITNDFFADGAPTGLSLTYSYDEQVARINALIGQGKTKKAFKALGTLIENWNQMMENGVRLATYEAARKEGTPREDAATLAKDLTVNFNRKGENSSAVNLGYLFFNAAMQGNVNFLQALGRSDVKTAGKMAAVKAPFLAFKAAKLGAMGIVSAGFTITAYNILRSELDDDEETNYADYTESQLERTINILPFEGSKGIALPGAYGYMFLYNIGRNAAELAWGVKDAPAAAMSLASNFITNFSPVALSEGDDIYQRARGLAPDVFEFGLDLAVNKNYFGSPIQLEQFPMGAQKADAFASKQSTDRYLKATTEFLNNTVGGGDEYIPGKVFGLSTDFNPDQMQYYFDFFLGGLGRFVGDSADTATKLVLDPGDLELSDLPIARSFSRKPSPYKDRVEYYKNYESYLSIVETRDSARAANMAGDPAPMERFKSKYSAFDTFEMTSANVRAIKGLSALKKRKRHIQMTEEDPVQGREKLDEIFKQEDVLHDKFNKVFRAARKKSGNRP